MGIRDTQYYGWRIIDSLSDASYSAHKFDMSGNLWLCGQKHGKGYIRKGIPQSGSFRFEEMQVFLISGSVTGSNNLTAFYDIAIDSSGSVFACGYSDIDEGVGVNQHWIVVKSQTGASGTFSLCDDFTGDNPFSSSTATSANGIAIDSQDRIYVQGGQGGSGGSPAYLLRRSTNHGVSWQIVDGSGSKPEKTINSYGQILIDASDSVYTFFRAFMLGSPFSAHLCVRKSTTGNSGTFVDWATGFTGSSLTPTPTVAHAYRDPLTNTFYYACGSSVAEVQILVSGSSGSLQLVDSYQRDPAQSSQPRAFCIDSTRRAYVGGWANSGSSSTGAGSLRLSDSLASGSYFLRSLFNSPVVIPGSTVNAINGIFEYSGSMYMIGYFGGTIRGIGFVLQGTLTANSASLGPQMLATSFGYVKTEVNGFPETAFKLNNVSEFSYGGGLFQMPNLVLGTTESGKIGKTDDSIIRVNHIGSVVKVMWPKQDSIEKPIKGFGDFSAGERSGKLTTTFQPGEALDVTEYDHMTLFGYLSKEASGTLDDIIITIERKPLKDSAFAIDQSIDYAISGSKTEARLRDIEYKKQVDYGDLSINKIGFPIDVPLTNTKQIRISARHRLGQAIDANKNFIVWGRFIKASKETNET